MAFWDKKKKREGDFDPFDPFSGLDDDFERSIFADMKPIEDMMRSLMNPEIMRKLQQDNKPIVSGFSIRIGPNGKMDFEQFGNVVPKGQKPVIKDEREPLVDVINRKKEVSVIAELPGVDKKDISIKVSGENDALDILVPHKFSKKVRLPARVKPKSAKANYKNGVLEVNLEKEKEDKGDTGTIQVE